MLLCLHRCPKQTPTRASVIWFAVGDAGVWLTMGMLISCFFYLVFVYVGYPTQVTQFLVQYGLNRLIVEYVEKLGDILQIMIDSRFHSNMIVLQEKTLVISGQLCESGLTRAR